MAHCLKHKGNYSDDFWMFSFKVVPCTKTYAHSWSSCPCAHPGETARRRDPTTCNYQPVLCPNVKSKSGCPAGDACGYAHNVFEQWLHPQRYKALMCTYGSSCTRPSCFFAHSLDELRVPWKGAQGGAPFGDAAAASTAGPGGPMGSTPNSGPLSGELASELPSGGSGRLSDGAAALPARAGSGGAAPALGAALAGSSGARTRSQAAGGQQQPLQQQQQQQRSMLAPGGPLQSIVDVRAYAGANMPDQPGAAASSAPVFPPRRPSSAQGRASTAQVHDADSAPQLALDSSALSMPQPPGHLTPDGSDVFRSLGATAFAQMSAYGDDAQVDGRSSGAIKSRSYSGPLVMLPCGAPSLGSDVGSIVFDAETDPAFFGGMSAQQQQQLADAGLSPMGMFMGGPGGELGGGVPMGMMPMHAAALQLHVQQLQQQQRQHLQQQIQQAQALRHQQHQQQQQQQQQQQAAQRFGNNAAPPPGAQQLQPHQQAAVWQQHHSAALQQAAAGGVRQGSSLSALRPPRAQQQHIGAADPNGAPVPINLDSGGSYPSARRSSSLMDIGEGVEVAGGGSGWLQAPADKSLSSTRERALANDYSQRMSSHSSLPQPPSQQQQQQHGRPYSNGAGPSFPGPQAPPDSGPHDPADNLAAQMQLLNTRSGPSTFEAGGEAPKGPSCDPGPSHALFGAAGANARRVHGANGGGGADALGGAPASAAGVEPDVEKLLLSSLQLQLSHAGVASQAVVASFPAREWLQQAMQGRGQAATRAYLLDLLSSYMPSEQFVAVRRLVETLDDAGALFSCFAPMGPAGSSSGGDASGPDGAEQRKPMTTR